MLEFINVCLRIEYWYRERQREYEHSFIDRKSAILIAVMLVL